MAYSYNPETGITTTDTATNDAKALNTSSFTKLVDANDCRVYFSVSNPNGDDIILNFDANGQCTDDKGLHIPSGGGWEMPTGVIYTGEINAISVTGTPTVLVLEY